MAQRKMIDLGFANGWDSEGIEQRLYQLVQMAGLSWKEVQHDIHGYDTVYECEEAGLRYHVDSSD